MRFKIVQVGEPVLRRAAAPLSLDDLRTAETQELIDWMRDTMRDAPGVGLAAPQVGLSIQLAVIEDRPEYLTAIEPERLAELERRPVPFLVLVNPQIVAHSDDQVEFFEGCLSLNGFGALVKRSHAVTVEALDRNGEPQRIQAHGWYARILQHEIDHLNGRLYIDRMAPRSFSSVENVNRYWKDLPIREARKALGLE
jgi:peptide deformylase